MDPRVTELHCIMPLANVVSVMSRGILCYESAAALDHRSVALQPVQDKRDLKHVPGGLKLHQYANLYFHARNPMLYKRLSEVDSLCVLRISSLVLEVDGVVITDQNAASDYVRFLHPGQHRFLDFDAIYAMSWKHPNDQVAEWRHKSRKCAEVLVPHFVDSRFVVGAYVANQSVRTKLGKIGFCLPITVDRIFFFQSAGGA